MKKHNISRRQLIGLGLGTGISIVSTKALANMCMPIQQQPEGPFYPVADQDDKNNDLTFVNGNDQKARGEEIIVFGQVTGTDCEPIVGALVEIWQACDTGKYNHPQDPNDADLDPDFQYWGQTLTNAQGKYAFKTIKPGAYPASADWIRPPHIHYKAHALGFDELTTQMYFTGEFHNGADRILQSLPQDQQDLVVIDFETGDHQGEELPIGQFDIQMQEKS